MKTLIKLMLKEEYRLHASYSSEKAFITFPMVILLFSFSVSLFSENILHRIDSASPLNALKQVLAVIHISIFLYGLSVGAFGFLGRQYIERRYGKSNFLISMPTILPISFKKTFLGLYIRDVIFYILLIILPLNGGLLLSIPITHFHVTTVMVIFMTTTLTFLLGLSFSFFVSAVYIRNIKLFAAIIGCIIILLIGYSMFELYSLSTLIPTIGLQFTFPPLNEGTHFHSFMYLVVNILLILAFSAGATEIIEERFESKAMRFKNIFSKVEKKLTFSRGYSTMLTKEFIDLLRSGTVTKMIFSFITPLLFLSFAIWFVNYGLNVPVGFNSVFYAGMIGFFGISLYSWLNNIDVNDYYQTLPVTVPQLIKTKLFAFLLLTTWISIIFVVGISIFNEDTSLIWLALLVMLITSLYMVVMTAYLTGLRTNTFLFDVGVLTKFSIMALLPEFCISILSFSLKGNGLLAISGIGIVCLILIGATYILYNRIDTKWARTEFI